MTLLLAVLWAGVALSLADSLYEAARRPRMVGWTTRRNASRCFSGLPDFFELLALGLSCGHPVSSAWSSASRFMPPGPLKAAVTEASASLAFGRPADQCMKDLSRRIGDTRATMALALIAQALVMGNSVEASLLSQAASIRRLIMTDIERRAQTAPLRMMLPVMLLILPAVMLVLLGPVVLRLRQDGGMFGF